MIPVRIQRKRTRGYDMQAESRALNGLPAVYVGRPHPLGNPYVVGSINVATGRVITPSIAVTLYDCFINQTEFAPVFRLHMEKIRGHNLACWCGLDDPFHASVLLEIANR